MTGRVGGHQPTGFNIFFRFSSFQFQRKTIPRILTSISLSHSRAVSGVRRFNTLMLVLALRRCDGHFDNDKENDVATFRQKGVDADAVELKSIVIIDFDRNLIGSSQVKRGKEKEL